MKINIYIQKKLIGISKLKKINQLEDLLKKLLKEIPGERIY